MMHMNNTTGAFAPRIACGGTVSFDAGLIAFIPAFI